MDLYSKNNEHFFKMSMDLYSISFLIHSELIFEGKNVGACRNRVTTGTVIRKRK